MNDAARAKLERIQQLIGVIGEAERELEGLLEGISTPLAAKISKEGDRSEAKPKPAKRSSTCGKCGNSGHNAKTCGRETQPSKPKSGIFMDDGDIADAIRDEWGELKRPSAEVAKELGISLAKFNQIVHEHEIVQRE